MIVSQHIIAMINHWLSSSPNAYLGSDYGPDLNGLLLRPLNSNVSNQFIAKMKKDIPILSQLSGDQINLYTANQGFEKIQIILSIGDLPINLTQVAEQLGARDNAQSF